MIHPPTVYTEHFCTRGKPETKKKSLSKTQNSRYFISITTQVRRGCVLLFQRLIYKDNSSTYCIPYLYTACVYSTSVVFLIITNHYPLQFSVQMLLPLLKILLVFYNKYFLACLTEKSSRHSTTNLFSQVKALFLGIRSYVNFY